MGHPTGKHLYDSRPGNEAAQSLWKRACSSTSKTNNHFKRLHKGAAGKIQERDRTRNKRELYYFQ